MEVTAKTRFIRQSPRKVRLVSDLIKGLGATAARDQLKFLPKKAAVMVLKTLNSAIANAEHNYKLAGVNLFVARAFVDQGPTLKRSTPKAFGRAAQIRKRSSHLTIILSEQDARRKKQDANKFKNSISKLKIKEKIV